MPVSASHRWGTLDTRLIGAVTLIESRLSAPPGDAELAGVCGVSIRQMQRLFANAFLTTPQAFALAWRLDQAQALLIQSDLTIIEIALICGFQSTSHFGRRYRRRFGVSASVHRGRQSP